MKWLLVYPLKRLIIPSSTLTLPCTVSAYQPCVSYHRVCMSRDKANLYTSTVSFSNDVAIDPLFVRMLRRCTLSLIAPDVEPATAWPSPGMIAPDMEGPPNASTARERRKPATARTSRGCPRPNLANHADAAGTIHR